MKNCTLIFLLVIPTLIFGQKEFGNFKIENGLIMWQKVYEEDLNLESQKLSLQPIGLPTLTTKIWLQTLYGAELVVEKKDGRTRVTVKKIFAVSNRKPLFGSVEENVTTPTYIEDVYVKKKNGEFRPLFLRKDGDLINTIIEREINALLPSDDDW